MNDRLYYIYRHIRLDTNEVFYIGQAVKTDKEHNNFKSEYKRAFQKQKDKRSRFWHNIVSNTDYRVEIIADNLTFEEANNKEIEFVSLYGRRNLGLGTLVNLTNGGSTTQSGRIFTNETREKMSKSQLKSIEKGNREKTNSGSFKKGQKLSIETIEKIRESRIGRKQTEKAKEKISIANSGKIGVLNGKSKKVIDLETNPGLGKYKTLSFR